MGPAEALSCRFKIDRCVPLKYHLKIVGANRDILSGSFFRNQNVMD